MDSSRGFSLAELLLALLILGQIATFAIPKVLIAQQSSQRQAVMKESIALLAELTARGVQQGELTGLTTYSYYSSRINAVKVCPTDASTEGCWNTGVQGLDPNDDYDEPGFVLASGAVIAGADDWAGNYNTVVIDWNGLQGPNLAGQDQISLAMCFSGSCGQIYGSRPKQAGTIGPENATSATLYETLFAN